MRWSASPNGTRNAPANSMDLVADFGGVGDGQRNTTINITVSSASPTLTVDTGVFVPGDAGKAISIWNGSNYKTATISSYTSSTVVTLNSNVGFTVTNSSSEILWGTDNTSAFITGWRTWARTQTNPASPPVLYVPDGSYVCFLGVGTSSVHYGVLNNVKISGLSGTAANCKLMNLGNGEMRFGTDVPIVANRGYNTTQSGGNSVRLATATAGATTTSVVSFNTTAADGSRFDARIVVGRACLLACYDHQGLYNSFIGYPPNNFYYEWNVIQGYDSTTGVVTFQNPLSQGYKSTFPAWGLENTQFGSDQGGPFTMWVAPDGYNNTVTLENFTIDCPRNQVAAHMRHVVLNNLVMNGPGLYPTQCDTFTATNCTYPQQLEVDKMVNQVTWNNCTLKRLEQQSASPNRSILNGGSIETLELAKYTEATGVAFTGGATLRLGVSTHGRADRAVITNCTGIASIVRGGANTDDLNGSSGSGSQAVASSFLTFNAGVIRFLKSINDGTGGGGNSGQQNLTRVFVPGTWIMFDDKYIDQVADVYEDGTYCYIQFANTTNWPFTPISRLRAHPCPDLTITGCTGTALNLQDFQAATARSPAYSYSKRTHVGGPASATVINQDITLFGRLVTEKINVTTPYVGAGTLTFNDERFLNRTQTDTSGSTTFSYGNTVNAKIGGERTIRAATTPLNAQTGDSLEDQTSIGQVQFNGTGGATIWSANVTNGETPTITVEYIMDQGI